MSSWAEAYDAIRSAYQQHLGRPPESSSVIEGWLSGGTTPEAIAAAVSGIAATPEAVAYAARPPASSTMPVGGPSPVTPTTPTMPTAQVFTGFTPTHAMEGFDTAREQNTGRSAKDAFAALANAAPSPPLEDKAALAAWFRQYIEPGMNALGHRVTRVDGDTFSFSNWQGSFDVDYGRGAGATGGALAWQADPVGGVPPTAGTEAPPPLAARVVPDAPAPAPTSPAPTLPPTDPGAPMATLAPPMAAGDVSMATLASGPAAAPVDPLAAEDLTLGALAQQRADRTRHLRWKAGAV